MTPPSIAARLRMGSQPDRIKSSEIHETWSELTPDEVDWIDGRLNRLIHALVSKYGISRDNAARQVVDFVEQHHIPEASK